MSITLRRQFAGIDAGTPVVMINKGATDKAPLLAEFIVDISGCSFDTTDVFDPLFPSDDYSGQTHDPSKHRLLYLWDLDDSVAQWDAPQNIPAEYANRSKALGKKVQHVYTTAQTVNWKLEIWEPSSGKKAFASGTFTVADPIATAEHIVLVNPNGDTDFTEINRASYPGATFYERQLASGNSFGSGAEFTTYTGLSNVCWLFKTGGTYAVSMLHPGRAGLYPYIGQYGSTGRENPAFSFTGSTVITTAPQGVGTPVAELRVQGIDFPGTWTTFETVAAFPSGGAPLIPKGGWRTIYADCALSNIQGQAVRMDAVNADIEVHIGVANTVLHNIMGAQYPMIIGNSSLARLTNVCFVGNRFTDAPTLRSGPLQGSTNGNHRALIRINTPSHCHVRGSDFFYLAGGNGQPIIKLNKAAMADAYMGVQFCVGEGSNNFVNFVEDFSGQIVPVSDAGILECCIFIHLPEGQRLLGATSTGNTARSCLLVVPGWDDLSLSQGDNTYRSRGFWNPAGDGVPNVGDQAPNEIYSMHSIAWRTRAQNNNNALGSNVSNGTVVTPIGGRDEVLRVGNVFSHAPWNGGSYAASTYSPIVDDHTDASDAILRPDGMPMQCRFIGWNPNGTPDTTYSYQGAYIPRTEFENGSPAVPIASQNTLLWPLDYLGRICGPGRAAGGAERPGYAFDLPARAG